MHHVIFSERGGGYNFTDHSFLGQDVHEQNASIGGKAVTTMDLPILCGCVR